MDEQQNKKSQAHDFYLVEATSDFKACSAMDCTGLIPSLPQSEDELEFYEELYPFITYPINGKKQ